MTVNVPGVTLWCGLSPRGLIGPNFRQETVMQMMILMIPNLSDLFENENGVYFQQDGAPAHFLAKLEMFSITHAIRDGQEEEKLLRTSRLNLPI